MDSADGGLDILFPGFDTRCSGVFGAGPLSHASFASGGAQVQYERFLRFESEAEVIFHLTNIKDTAHLTIPKYAVLEIDGSISIIPQKNGEE